MIQHFGIWIHEKPNNHINKELYLSAKPEGMPKWTEADYGRQRALAEINYDANMSYFASLSKEEFDAYIEEKCKEHRLTECDDLNTLSGVKGLYMLVLDEYKQVYIGISTNIKQRIQSHWSKSKSLERLICGSACRSVLSIDSFGTLDTTRIFYKVSKSPAYLEKRVASKFDPCYTLNRTAGGIGYSATKTDDPHMALLSAAANIRYKDLIPFIDVMKLKDTVSIEQFNFYLRRHPDLLEKYRRLKQQNKGLQIKTE